MTDPESNYSRLERQFFFGTGAQKGDAIVSSYRHRQNYSRLAYLLRPHWGEDIQDNETYSRDEIDYLLSFYGILELALLTGMISEIPNGVRSKVLANLSNPALRKYYEENYPLILPQLLLRRLTGDLCLRERTSADVLSQFMRFLVVTKTMDIDDDDVETFLWFLDDGERDGYDYGDLERALDQPRVFTNALTKSRRQRDSRDHAINGFRKFLLFCTEFNLLLALTRRSYPLMTAEMYAHEAYWFIHLGDKAGRRVHKAIRKFRSNDSPGSPLWVQLSNAESAVGTLLSGRYLVPLRKYHTFDSVVRNHPKLIVALNLKDKTVVRRMKPKITTRFGWEAEAQGTSQEVGQNFAVTGKRIREIEAKALRKWYPFRSRKLRTLMKRSRE